MLLPVLDDDKHYWVGTDEVEKLLRRGGAWLAAHPQRELITRRYLRHDRRLTDDALARLVAADDSAGDPDDDGRGARPRGGRSRAAGSPQRPAPRRGRSRARGRGRAQGRRPRLRAGLVAARPPAGVVGRPGRGRRRVVPRAGNCEATAALRRDAAAPARAHRPVAGRADLPRQAAARVRRGRGGGGHRASRPVAPRRRSSASCSATPGRRPSSSPRPTSSTTSHFEGLARRIAAPPRPPLRVDARRVRIVVRRRVRTPRLHGAVLADRPGRRRGGRAHADGGVPPVSTEIKIPDLCLVALVGVSGSGKSTFAARHFQPTEVVSSDFCRGARVRRRERPGRDRRRVRGAAHHRGQAARGRAGSS